MLAKYSTLFNRFEFVPVADLPDWTLPSVSLNLWRGAPQVFFGAPGMVHAKWGEKVHGNIPKVKE